MVCRNISLCRTVSTESSPPVLVPHLDPAQQEANTSFRRSLSPFPSYHPASTTEPPSYTSVFNSETENVTPPPQYNNIDQV